MQTGQINVQTENIFPIIKKFLYSDTEIFVRELVSNAVDATQKIKTLSSLGEYKGDLGNLQVEVLLDKEAKTLTIRDRGIGMTADEVDKYINQIAFSGAEEFVEKYKDKAEAIIGHFGLGFYSSFMVSDKVNIITKSYQKDAKAVKWESNGTPEFTIEEIEKEERGTDIVLHIAEDSVEFLEDARISGILKKYCKFLPHPIIFGERSNWIEDPEGEKDEEGNVKKVEEKVPDQINNTAPTWVKKPSDLSDEDYKDFYNELYPFTEEPLFNIHLNVDYPFNLTGVLYFPRLKNNVEVQKNKIQLYSNQVFITDSVENIVPDFLTLLHGVIDSPDIPLNVSRSYLQSDSNVKKISNHITKKVADKLSAMFKDDRDDFQNKWDDIKVFIQYGMLSEDKFYDKAQKFNLFKTTDGDYFTTEEFKEKISAAQTDKDDKLVILYATDVDEQHAFIATAKERGYTVAVMDSPLDVHVISMLEQKLDKTTFARVDADTIDKLIQKEEEQPSKLTKEDEEKLKPVFEGLVSKDKFVVQFESMSETDVPMMITQSEFMRRMKEQQAMGGGGMNFMGNMPEMFNLVVNANHPLTSQILGEKSKKAQKNLAKQATDLALLAQGMLKGEELTAFIKRSVGLLSPEK
ncbi:MAG: molecular chaperone HtpG [Crocinitomicaceae bacterium]|nr:molecular chaperone HtpG [Crocinitomicaceae bacterium]